MHLPSGFVRFAPWARSLRSAGRACPIGRPPTSRQACEIIWNRCPKQDAGPLSRRTRRKSARRRTAAATAAGPATGSVWCSRRSSARADTRGPSRRSARRCTTTRSAHPSPRTGHRLSGGGSATRMPLLTTARSCAPPAMVVRERQHRGDRPEAKEEEHQLDMNAKQREYSQYRGDRQRHGIHPPRRQMRPSTSYQIPILCVCSPDNRLHHQRSRFLPT